MFRYFFKDRVHEPLAIAAILATAITLNVAWIINMLVERVPLIQRALTFSPMIGPVSGMYLLSLTSFIGYTVFLTLFLRGKDCSHLRSTVLRFFLFSLIAFFVMTLPFIYTFSIVVE